MPKKVMLKKKMKEHERELEREVERNRRLGRERVRVRDWSDYRSSGKIAREGEGWTRAPKKRETKYAFVQCRFEDELLRAIRYDQNIKLDGRFLTVKEADKAKDGSKGRNQMVQKKMEEFIRERGLPSYREVVTNGMRGDTISKTGIDLSKVDGIKVKITGEEVEWLRRSALGHLKSQICYREVQSYLQKKGIMVLMRQAGDLNVIVTFGDKGEMEVLLDQYYDIFSIWFKDIKLYNMEKDERRYKVWVKIEELPFHLWHLKMFEAIGNCWGKFLKVDQETERKSRLDVAVIKVEVMSKRNVPVNQQIIVNGKAYIMRTSIIREESCDMERQACDETFCKAWACLEPISVEQREVRWVEK
ncbi:Uncharacterized protein TCM_025498 [Theobroma cacao]|uniref:Uncharacterized protein n=1 Tax=Theobroma cacao TaxID=3641 RepID=A0A061EYE8_THECC|nr:Uncharacterized protein TCM_025498 [Theobroma cacao]